ncbi:MAG: HAD family phosphatase [Ardenticatenaceae bacterium]|nr:HAD family phosphatase [Ardenticatenaceae bacterium]
MLSKFKVEKLKAVIFDVGGVMLRTKTHQFRHQWDERLGLAHGSVEHLVFNSDLGTAAQTGQTSIDAHWEAVAQYLGLSPADQGQLRHDFWVGDAFDYAMIDWIRSWRTRYQTAIISNAFDDLRSVLTDEFSVGDAFDLIVVSAEEGVMKPDPEIYLRTLTRLNCAPDEAVFIDDNPGNIEGAQAVGLPGILYVPDIDLPALLPLSGV